MVEKLLDCRTREDQIIKGIPVDISKEESVDFLFDYVNKIMDGFDILVNNAGVFDPIEKIDEIDWEKWKSDAMINLLERFIAQEKRTPWKDNKYFWGRSYITETQFFFVCGYQNGNCSNY